MARGIPAVIRSNRGQAVVEFALVFPVALIVLFGLFVAGTMLMIMRLHAANQREHDSLALIGEHKH